MVEIVLRKKRSEKNKEIARLKDIALESTEINIKKRTIDALSAYGTHEAIDAISAIIMDAGGANVKEYGLESIREIRYLNM